MRVPQKCPFCERSLGDPGVPRQYRRYRGQFTLAKVDVEGTPQNSGRNERGLTVWICPFCDHRFTDLEL